MKFQPGRGCQDPGFSLIELLIAITLLGFILTLLFAGFRFAQRSWDSAERYMENTARNQAGRHFLKNTLAQIYPHRWTKSPGQTLAFRGTPGDMRFVTELPPHMGSGGLQQIQLSVEKIEGSARLMFRNTVLLPDALDFDTTTEEEGHTLIPAATNISFSYYGPDTRNPASTPNATSSWQEEWSSAKQMPQLVRIRFEVLPPWPDLIIAPMIAQESGCFWDDFYKRCIPGR